MQRKQQKPSIFVNKKKPLPRRPPPPPQASNGSAAGSTSQQAQTNGAAQAPQEDDGDWQEYPIYVSKDTLTRGLHYHAMKLHAQVWKDGQKVPVNPYDPSQFTRPLQLHRRSARDKLAQAEQPDASAGVDDKERELINIRREERQREREANQAQIAPTGSDPRKPRQKPKKKVEDVWQDDQNEHKMKLTKLKYEETRPWHLEDFEHKHIYVGRYEEPPSEESVLFEIGQNGFRMVPVEKWYRFTEQSTRVEKNLDSDQVEKEWAKKAKVPRWFNKTQQANDEERKQAYQARMAKLRGEQRGGDEEEMVAPKDEYNADVDEMDFEFNDEFQDDDEGAMFGDLEGEDAKEIERKLREEMRNAGLGATGIKDEDRDYDAEEEKQREEEKAEKRRTKRMRKALLKKERKNEYDDDSEHGEFSESSESEDSEEERERLEQEAKQEEARKANGEKSGGSTRGTNTPSGRTEKKDPTRLGNSLKRPGSPDLSELSGNESSRKRPKVNGVGASNGARALSRKYITFPRKSGHVANSYSADVARGSHVPRSTGGSGSGSETEASTREGRPKIKLRNSPPTSPNGSRAATPSGSRAQSPQRNKRAPFPTLEEVRAAIPADGIGITELVNLFKSRVNGRTGDFIPLVKSAGRQDPVSKKILPKTAAEMGQQGS